MPEKAEADKTSWCYQVWFLLHKCMTGNSFKHDLLDGMLDVQRIKMKVEGEMGEEI